jgi:hypothetical protein
MSRHDGACSAGFRFYHNSQLPTLERRLYEVCSDMMAYPIVDVVRYCFISPPTSVLGLRWLDRPMSGIDHRPWLLLSFHVAARQRRSRPLGTVYLDPNHEVTGRGHIHLFCFTQLSGTGDGDRLNVKFGVPQAFADALVGCLRPAGSSWLSAALCGTRCISATHVSRDKNIGLGLMMGSLGRITQCVLPASRGKIEAPSRLLAGVRWWKACP